MDKMTAPADPNDRALTDRFGRLISYLRLSVTDRCDLRCSYCMAERMTFLPKADVLSLEELEHLAVEFINRGVQKIRITGGEPLVRAGIMQLVYNLGKCLGTGLEELTLTTNGTHLEKYANDLFDAGVRRVNVSLDAIDTDLFRKITRRGNINSVLKGIDAAQSAGLAIKINTVALKQDNFHHIPQIVDWAHTRGCDITLIEVMPLGDTGQDRRSQYVPLFKVRDLLEQKWALIDDTQRDRNGGPARYSTVAETGGRIGFISPLTNNFCAGCNRVRVTSTGQLFMCLGQDDSLDLRAVMRDGSSVSEALDRALGAKPEKHDFIISDSQIHSATHRYMSTTGG